MKILRSVFFLLCYGLSHVAIANPSVEVKTNFGVFEVELFADKTPRTVENFLSYVRDGYYHNTLFHRLIPNLLLQGGAYSVDWGVKAKREPIINESTAELSNSKWTLAMAHGSDPNSATTEFFINLGDNEDFDRSSDTHSAFYCVFGEITSGHEVIKEMIAVGVIAGGDFVGDRPSRDLIIEDIKILNDN